MDGREFVATIAIISHGRSTEFEISPTIANIFDNARIYTLSNQTGPVIAGSVLCTRTHNHLNKIFRRTLHNENTLHILEEYAKYSEPKYASFYSDMNERGKIYDPITFDKMYSVIEPDNYMGIFLISVHEKVPGHDNELRLVYPLLEHKNQNIDLAKLDDITTLGNYLGNDNITNIVAEITNGASPAFPEKERMQMMESVGKAPKVLDDKEVSLADIARLAGIKEYVEPVKHSKAATKMVESIVAEPKAAKVESSITKAIAESDADVSISKQIKEAVTKESSRLDKIAELETQLAELKMAEKEDATMDDKAFREAFMSEIAEYAKEAEANELVEIYNKFSANEVEMNENEFTIKTPETAEIIADAEKEVADAEAEVIADDEVTEKVKDFVDYDRNKEEPHTPEKDGEEEAEDKSDEKDDDGEVAMLDKDFDEGEAVELEVPAEDKFTNDLDPADKK